MIFSSCCAGHLVPFLLYNVFKGTASSCGERAGYRWLPTQALTSTHTGWARSCRRPASVAVAMGAFQDFYYCTQTRDNVLDYLHASHGTSRSSMPSSGSPRRSAFIMKTHSYSLINEI